MGVAKTVISVAIIGDAKKLIGAIGKADAATGGLLTSVGKVFVATQIVSKSFDIIGDVIHQADRAGDATSRINTLLGKTDTDKLVAIAGGFADIGVSAPDFLEIAAGFTEFASASGKIDPTQITDMAGGVVAFAGALGRLKDVDPATLGDDISNFISGTRGAAAAAKELGVPFDAALTPAQRYAQLMERLPGLLNSVTGANAGLDDKQSELQARWETLGSEVGPVLEQTLSNILGFILDEIAALPHAIQGFQMLDDAIGKFGQQSLGGLIQVKDVLNDIIGALQVATGIGLGGGSGANGAGSKLLGLTDSGVSGANNRNAARNGTVRDRIGGP